MLPTFLIPETTMIRENGDGQAISLDSSRGKLVLLTLGITRIIEQESLNVSIWGSPDNQNWGAKPLLCFPQKFYCGTYQLLLDLSEHAEVEFLRASCKVNRWGHSESKPLFEVFLFGQESEARAVARTA
jgi:hypothetical protein